MLLVFCSRSIASAFQGAPRYTRRTSKLPASFLDDLQKTFFSGMTAENPSSSSKYFTVGITGAGGLVGTALQDELSKRESINGKPIRIVRLTRGSAPESKDLGADQTILSLTWNPDGASPEEVIDPAAIAEMDSIVHLAGENVATGSGPLGFLGIQAWSEEKKIAIMQSRLVPTRALAQAVASTSKPQLFLVASGIGVYGDNFIGDEREAVDETADISGSNGFLADVSRQWEAASENAKVGKNRVVNMRFGVVLSKKGGALGKLFPVFYLGGGGNVGSGKQNFSYISARDLARAIVFTLETPSLQGPVNFSAPNPCTNSEFTKALGKAMGRPTILPFPAFAVSLLFGEMGEEMLLGGVKALPGKLSQSGFEFQHPTIADALKSALEEDI